MINFDPTAINLINSSQNIDESIPVINTNYTTLQNWVSSLQFYYDNNIQPIINYYNEYSSQLNSSLTLAQSYSANWNDFQTIVETNSSKWLTPLTIFYPTLIENSITQDDINTIIKWLNQYFPIANSDGSLNYIQKQSILISCYLYTYGDRVRLKNDYAYSYTICSTHGASLHGHCQTKITGGWVHCEQGSYLCDYSIDCYPSLKVNCWYGDPYLYDTGLYGGIIPPENPPPISNKSKFNSYVNNRSKVRGQILADISMDFIDKKETSIQTLKFIVNNCEWSYVGNL